MALWGKDFILLVAVCAMWHDTGGMQENDTGVVWSLRAACPAEMEIQCSVQGNALYTTLK